MHEGQQSSMGPLSLPWILQKQRSPIGSSQTRHFCGASPLVRAAGDCLLSDKLIKLLGDVHTLLGFYEETSVRRLFLAG